MCSRYQALIDFFIHANDGSTYLVQVSTLSYAEHSLISEQTRRSVIAQFQEALRDPTGKAPICVYITTSTSLMHKNLWSRNAKYSSAVRLISNANGAAGRYFRNLLK